MVAHVLHAPAVALKRACWRRVTANMLLIAFGVLVCAYGELNLVVKGLILQLSALAFEVRSACSEPDTNCIPLNSHVHIMRTGTRSKPPAHRLGSPRVTEGMGAHIPTDAALVPRRRRG
jgi:hypothetical protein